MIRMKNKCKIMVGSYLTRRVACLYIHVTTAGRSKVRVSVLKVHTDPMSHDPERSKRVVDTRI